MDDPFLKAQQFHDRAAKMRQMAAREEDWVARTALMEIARGYEHLAAKFLHRGREALGQPPIARHSARPHGKRV